MVNFSHIHRKVQPISLVLLFPTMNVQLVTLNKTSNYLPARCFILLTLGNFDLDHVIKFGSDMKQLTYYSFCTDNLNKMLKG